MVDEILVPERDPADALQQHGLDGMLDQLRRAAVGEASRQALHQPDRPIRGAQQQRAGVRGHLATVEGSDHRAAFDPFISEQIAATLRRHRGTPLRRVKPLSQKCYHRYRAPMHLLA
jgi:Arc/MetJ family transcription regulator